MLDRPVDLDDRNILRNLSEIEATRTLLETLKAGVNALTVQDKGTTEIRSAIKRPGRMFAAGTLYPRLLLT